MFNLLDILQAQGGPGAFGFGQQFGLSQDQSRRAMEALLPAFTLGLQRNAANDPSGFAHLFGAMGGNPARPGTSPSPPQMDQLVQQLFGSQHLSQAVLQQAAAVSGVATPALKQMLPVMAGMIVAGIVHLMINQNQAAPPARAPAANGAFGFAANPYWSDMMNTFFSAGAVPAPPPPQRPAAGARPQKPSARTTDRSAETRAKPADGTPFDVFQQMFQTGLDVQQENANAMRSLFDTMWQDTTKVVGAEAAPAPVKRSRSDR